MKKHLFGIKTALIKRTSIILLLSLTAGITYSSMLFSMNVKDDCPTARETMDCIREAEELYESEVKEAEAIKDDCLKYEIKSERECWADYYSDVDRAEAKRDSTQNACLDDFLNCTE